MAEPALTAVTLPFDTVATLVLEDDHVTVLFVALPGLTVAVNVSDAPICSVSELLFKVTEVTAIGLTVIKHVAVLPPADAVIVAEPTLSAVTLPSETVATLTLEVVHVTVLSVALDGLTVAVSVSVPPISNVREDLLSVTDVTSIPATVNVR